MDVGIYVSRKNDAVKVNVVETYDKTKTLLYEGADGKTHSVSWSSFRKSYKKSEDAEVKSDATAPVEEVKTESEPEKTEKPAKDDKPVKEKKEKEKQAKPKKESRKVTMNPENLEKLKILAKSLGCDVKDRPRGFYYKKDNKRVCETFDRKGSIFICARDEAILKSAGCVNIENHTNWNMAWSGVISYEKSEKALAYIINNFKIEKKETTKKKEAK